ncbi:MAG: hypothetical protein KatS3mg115_2305 [Candidatus Poribacteria bacterium]|nr:MAG: hypothetical protein KatS3mg115_2305 [Candidatus Poribacteria bacterium]
MNAPLEQEEYRPQFDSIEDAIEAIRRGEMVIVVDDADRENEGDLTMAAQCVTPEAINFMAKYGRGLICVPQRWRAPRAACASRMVPTTQSVRTAFRSRVDAQRDHNRHQRPRPRPHDPHV